MVLYRVSANRGCYDETYILLLEVMPLSAIVRERSYRDNKRDNQRHLRESKN